MPTPTIELLQQVEDMFNDPRACTTHLEWNNTSYLERRLSELMNEHDAHSVIAAMLINYDVLRLRLKHRSTISRRDAILAAKSGQPQNGAIIPTPAPPPATNREPPRPKR